VIVKTSPPTPFLQGEGSFRPFCKGYCRGYCRGGFRDNLDHLTRILGAKPAQALPPFCRGYCRGYCRGGFRNNLDHLTQILGAKPAQYLPPIDIKLSLDIAGWLDSVT